GLPDTFFRYGLEEDIEITRACIEARPPGTMISVWPAPNNVVYARQDLVRGAARLARELGTKWHGHCSEARSDPDRYVEEHGVRPVAWLEREGLLGPEATIAHGIWLDDAEMEALGRNQVGVAYTPLSHQFLSMGVIRLRDLRRAGAVVGLGTDGAVCNNRQDMFEVMKQSILLQRVATLDPTVSSGEEALELATREGARYLGIEAGVLAPGKLADLAVVDLGGAHLRPLHRVVAALAYSARGSDVAMTIVGGRVVYEDGACTLVQEAEVLAEAQARAEDLVERAGMQGLRAPWRRVEVSGAALAGR
ncbi:MAG TPA: amidohydrolase family protein, partial [Acidimicrobiia bacterium]